jgi:hypothetical protein
MSEPKKGPSLQVRGRYPSDLPSWRDLGRQRLQGIELRQRRQVHFNGKNHQEKVLSMEF